MFCNNRAIGKVAIKKIYYKIYYVIDFVSWTFSRDNNFYNDYSLMNDSLMNHPPIPAPELEDHIDQLKANEGVSLK